MFAIFRFFLHRLRLVFTILLLAGSYSLWLIAYELSESNEFENLAKRPTVIPSCIPNLQHTIYPKTKTPLLEITTGQKRPPNFNNGHINLDFIDHLAIAVEEKQSEKVCEWYQMHFKFQRLDDIKIQTSYNGMLLKVYIFLPWDLLHMSKQCHFNSYVVSEPQNRQPSFSKWKTNKMTKACNLGNPQWGCWSCCSNSYLFDSLDKSLNFRFSSTQTSG